MALGFERLALHSWRIGFESPLGGRMEIEAPIPEDFKKAVNLVGINMSKVSKIIQS